MKRKIQRIVAMLLILCVMVFSQIKGIYGMYMFYVVSEKQEKSNWCWAASSRALARQEGKVTKSQTDAVIYIKGKNVNDMASLQEYEKAAEYYSGKNFSTMVTPMTYPQITKMLDDGHLVGTNCGYYLGNYRYSGHSLYIVGYNNNDGQNLVVFVDPKDGNSDRLTYEKFCKRTLENGSIMKYEQTIYASYK